MGWLGWLLVATAVWWVWHRLRAGNSRSDVDEAGANKAGDSDKISELERKTKLLAVLQASDEDLYEWPSDEVEQEIVGESYHQPAILAVTGAPQDKAHTVECDAVLVPYKFKANEWAVAVMIGNAAAGKMDVAGHLARDEVSDFRAALRRRKLADKATACKAEAGCKRKPDGSAMCWVRLDLDWDADLDEANS